MGWERRGNRLYRYEKVRVGGRVVSVYAGSDRDGRAGLTDEAERRKRTEERERIKQERERIEAIEREAIGTERLAGEVLAAVLTRAGYHHHRGQWRKTRRPKQSA